MGDLTTLAIVKQYGGVTSSTDDALFTRLITAASAAVENYIGRSISAASHTAVMDGNGAPLLPLPQYPITAVSSVSINGVAQRASTSWGDGGYSHDGVRSIYFPGEAGYFVAGRRNVTVGYTAGYSTVPKDLEQAVTEMVWADYKLKDQMGWLSKSLAGETITLDLSAFSKSVRAVVDSYRNVLPI